MRIKKTIKLGKRKYMVIDLSEPLGEDSEVYPGDPRPEKIVFSEIQKTGCRHHIYKLGDHLFHPHGDAPSHQNPELQNKGFETFGLEYCFNPSFMIDLSNSDEAKKFDGVKYLVEVKINHLEPFKKILSRKRAFIIRTGYDKWLEKNKKHVPKNIPYLSKSAAGYLAGFGNIKVVGTDSITIDPCGNDKPVHDAHQTLKNKLIVESLVHLYEIPLQSRKNFDLQTSPVRIIGATGGPIVAYAFIELK